MSIRHKMHLRVLFSEFELIALFSALALLADTLWVCHDIHKSGLSFIYVCIFLLLSSALMGTAYICWTHHKKFVRIGLGKELKLRLKIVKKRARHVRR